jgi:hypothetical protein
MIEQFQHRLTNSFFLWFDNYLLTKGQAYSNLTGTFFNYQDERFDSSYEVFGSAYKQWVNDSSITGANIPSGVYVNGVFSGRNENLILDFENGRVLSSELPANAKITGSFAVKDFSVYFSNETEEDLIIENKYDINSRIILNDESYVMPYDYVIPAIFLSVDSVQNKGFALGGMEETTVMAKAVVIAENNYQLDGVLSIFADSRNEVFRPIPMANHPMNEFGDLKSGTYSYTTLKNQFSDSQNFYINNANTSKLTDKSRKSLTRDIYVGFIDFEIQQHRYRHQ